MAKKPGIRPSGTVVAVSDELTNVIGLISTIPRTILGYKRNGKSNIKRSGTNGFYGVQFLSYTENDYGN